MSEDPVFLALGSGGLVKQITGQEQVLALADPQNLNSYAYALNNPVLKSDPSGNSVTIPWVNFFPVDLPTIGAGVIQGSSRVLGITGALMGLFWPTILTDDSLLLKEKSAPQGVDQANQKNGPKTDTKNRDTSKKASDPYGPLPLPESLTGKTPEEIGKIMDGKGIPGKPSRGGGIRYPVPGRSGDQVRLEPGNPKNSDSVKQGPYGRVSQDGIKSDPFPLKGNPTLKQ